MIAIITTIIASGLTLVGVLWSNRASQIRAQVEQKVQQEKIAERLDRIEQNTSKSCEQIISDMNALRIELMELKDESRENDAMLKKATMHNAKDRLNQGHRYFMSLGKIDETSLQSMLAVWESYKELGGNSFIDREIKDLQSLPITSSLIDNSK